MAQVGGCRLERPVKCVTYILHGTLVGRQDARTLLYSISRDVRCTAHMFDKMPGRGVRGGVSGRAFSRGAL